MNSQFTIKELSRSEFCSIFVASVTLHSGLYYVTKEITDYGKMTFFAFMLITNAYFLMHLVTQILIEAYGFLLKKSKYLKYLYGYHIGYDHEKERYGKPVLQISTFSARYKKEIVLAIFSNLDATILKCYFIFIF